MIVGYGRLGVEHILTGFDHLLFVLGLVLLVRGGRRLLWTVTAFTLGHSMTLALAVLGFVHLPQQPIEAGIAFSIYVLAIDLAPHEPRKPTLLERAPWLAAGLFGLLHGLGFAGALAQVGLPQGDIPLALFSFNIGIEAGQLVFVGVVLGAWAGLRALPVRWPSPVGYIPAYAMGTLAALWFFQRVAASLTGFNSSAILLSVLPPRRTSYTRCGQQREKKSRARSAPWIKADRRRTEEIERQLVERYERWAQLDEKAAKHR